MSTCKSTVEQAQILPDAVDPQEAHHTSENMAPRGYPSDSVCNGEGKDVDILPANEINPPEQASEDPIERSFRISSSAKALCSRLPGSPKSTTPPSRIQPLPPINSKGPSVLSTVTLVPGIDSKTPAGDGPISSGSGMTLHIPPMYEDLPESSPWPTLFELEINEGIRDSLTALSMVEFKEATVAKQLRKPWACFSHVALGYDPESFKPLSHFTGTGKEEPQPWFQSLHYAFTRAVNSGAKRSRSPASSTKHPETKRKRVIEYDCNEDANCSGEPPLTENKSTEETMSTNPVNGVEQKSDKFGDSLGRQKRKNMMVVEEWDRLELNKISTKHRLLLRKAAENNPELWDKLEESDSRKSWMLMYRKDAPKAYRAWQNANKKQMQECKRIADLCRREVRLRATRSSKESMKSAPTMKRLCRDMIAYWRRADKEVADHKKQEERAAAEQRKLREEEIEEKRQAQKLSFLLNKTELYSHFMAHKLGVSSTPMPMSSNESEDENLIRQATIAAKAAVESTADRMKRFDVEYNKDREKTVSRSGEGGLNNQESLVNPSSMPTSSDVQQPPGFKGQLKAYQLKGLQWLVNLYEQGLNGILADEMGLGKTIQAIAFMAYLAEKKNIWGPFLVVTPASTLHNWDSELSKFSPSFKVLPYWGTQQDRKVLRQSFHPRKIYTSDPSFNVAITSYQLLIQDETYLKRVKWQYMILDEAQAIKSSSSVRWKTLLSFSCRNRILLTGTPIQNNLAELWALLHFIMPALFDSMEQFNGWFSKGLEQFVEGSHELNNAQLKRLHSLLSPFMLRRIKTDVAGEMVSKHERVVYCELSRRQKILYKGLREHVNLADLFDSDRKKVKSLMNLVIQLRKVCNHPELFEEQTERVSLYFAQTAVVLMPPAFGALPWVNHSGTRSHISFRLPRLVYREGVACGYSALSGSVNGFRAKWLHHCFLIYQPYNSYQSLLGGSFGFTRMIGLSLSDVHFLWAADPLQSWVYSQQIDLNTRSKLNYWERHFGCRDQDGQVFPARTIRFLLVDINASVDALRSTPDDADTVGCGPLVKSPEEKLYSLLDIVKRVRPGFVQPILAPPPSIHCSDRQFANTQKSWERSPWLRGLLFGGSPCIDMPCYSAGSPPTLTEISRRILQAPPDPALLWPMYRVFGSAPPAQPYALAKSLVDSGKMLKLDDLLRKLKAEKHRVLLFSQMTMMMNILVDYLSFRRYKFLRLDGQSSISDRRDMVNAFQTKPNIFVFLLSTRAGGLGINLTAADTVIFFESDWNPTMDLQAMDRAHRLGQTRDVVVYRLICRNTIEEKILQRAKEKSTVQQLVMTGQANTGDFFAPEEVASLLLDAEGSVPVEELGKKRVKNSTSLAHFYMHADNMEIAMPSSAEIDNDSAKPRSGK